LFIFIGGVPATGKTWLGSWLAATRGYLHVDAENDAGHDFDQAGVHREWDELLSTGGAAPFVGAVRRLSRPVVLNWGLPTRYLFVVAALREEGFRPLWFDAQRAQARAAFLNRGGLSVESFDRQMDDIEREWALIHQVFCERVISGLKGSGAQRTPDELWSEIQERRLTAACSARRR
jgi:hypothetical protein